MTRGVYRGWQVTDLGTHLEVALIVVYSVEGFPDDPVSEWMVPGTWHIQPKEGQHGEESKA